MGIYLGNKKIQIATPIVPAINYSKADTIVWTDGSQNSVTPAGFQDCGFRQYYIDTTDENGNRIGLPTADELSKTGFDARTDYIVSTNENTTITYEKILSNVGYSYNDSIRCYIDGEYKATSEVDLSSLKMSIRTGFVVYTSILTQLTKFNSVYHITGKFESGYYQTTAKVIDGVKYVVKRNTSSECIVVLYHYDTYTKVADAFFFASSGLNTCDIYKSLAAYDNYYIDVIVSNGICSSDDLLIGNLVIYPYESPYGASKVTAQTTDYESITSELTARGNTITSLNTQGQNNAAKANETISKFNDIIDKYGK